MNTPHTPGPWKASGRYIAAASYHLAVITSAPPEMDQEWKSNARLIAAAPELLHALQLVMTWNGIYDQSVASAPKAIAEFNMEVGDKIRSAIAKATGQTP